jgi:acetolactate synthase-1/2/3 large subunit
VRASDVLVRCLENEGVRFIFGVPGEENLDVIDSLLGSSIRFITTRHEQGAAFMADVYGRLSGTPGVCLSTLGPGATNLITGVADANLDHAPLVAISGQVSLDRKYIESHQYIDLLALFKPITKWNSEISLPQMIPEAVRKAFKVAQTEKPGAIHLVLPEDVAAQHVSQEEAFSPLMVQAPFIPESTAGQIKRAVAVLQHAKRPIFLAGNGVVRRHAEDALRRCARTLGIPVVHTFMGKGIMPDHDALSLYTVGLPIRDYAAQMLEQADVVIAAGYDLVEFAPCFWNPNRDKQVIHVDVLPAEVDAHYHVAVGVLGDIAQSLDHMTEGHFSFENGWAARAREAVLTGLEKEQAAPPVWPLRPQHIIQEMRSVLAPEDIVISDVGAHKLWMARMFPCYAPNTCIISNGFASMGIGLPGAVAAQLLFPSRRVMVVTGDGGFLMNSQEMETVVRLQLPLIVLIWRDNGYGVIRWKQMMHFGRTSSVDFANPDFVAYARAYGALGFRVEGPSELKPVLQEALKSGHPAIIDCPVDYEENLRLANSLPP